MASNKRRYTDKTAESHGKTTAGERQQLLLSSDGFKQLLLKWSSRHLKTGNTFALLSISHELGDDKESSDKRQSNQFVKACLNSLRLGDRMAPIDETTYIVFLSDVDLKAAGKVKNRLVEDLGAFQNNVVVQVSFDHDGTGSIDSLLMNLDIAIDAHGHLVKLQTQAKPSPAGLAVLANWQRRYDLLGKKLPTTFGASESSLSLEARDLWAEKAPVTIEAITLNGDGLEDISSPERIIKKCSILQSFDHPNVARIIDFYLKDYKILYLVLPAQPRKQTNNLPDNLITDVNIANWAQDLLQGLIYLQTAVPPVVPTADLQTITFLTPEDQLILTGFETGYILTDQPAPSVEDLTRSYAQFLQIFLAKLESPLAIDLKVLTKELLNKKKPLPEKADTPYKLRTTIKRMIATHLPLLPERMN